MSEVNQPAVQAEVEPLKPVKRKPHYFEIAMNSTSDVGADADPIGDGGVYLNQEVLIREYAFTPGELTLKQMKATKDVIPAIVKSFDEMSQPYQELGMAEAAGSFPGGSGSSLGASSKAPGKK